MAHTPLSDEALSTIFKDARTHYHWQPKPVEEQLLHSIYDLMKMGPTSANTCPARILFVQSKPEKEKLLTAMDKGNVEKTRTAPVTAILAQDMEFYEKLPKLMPHVDARSWFAGDDELIRKTAFRNSSLQGAYLIIAARSLGLDCGPMSGFNNEQVDELFFKGTTWRSNFVINLGYGDPAKLYPRSPRLAFEEAARII